MSLNYPNVIHAAGSVNGSTGVALWQAGAVSARSATGIYTLTLDNPADASECAVLVFARGASVAFGSAEQTSDTVKTINMVDAAASPQDTDFDFLIIRAPGS